MVGLGSNLGDSLGTLRSGVAALAAAPGVRVDSKSRLYCSPAMTLPKSPPQPDYLNAALRISSALSPPDLLSVLQGIEAACGRVRTGRWQPRTLDLDLLWSDSPFSSSDLTIPHVGLTERWWALRPMLDVAPELERHYGPFLARLGPVRLNPGRL